MDGIANDYVRKLQRYESRTDAFLRRNRAASSGASSSGLAASRVFPDQTTGELLSRI